MTGKLLHEDVWPKISDAIRKESVGSHLSYQCGRLNYQQWKSYRKDVCLS